MSKIEKLAIALGIFSIIVVIFLTGASKNIKLGALQTTGENSFSNTSTSSVSVASTSATTILAANFSRQYARITNLGVQDVYISLGSSALINSGIRLAQYGIYEINPQNEYKGIITGIASGSPMSVITVEK